MSQAATIETIEIARDGIRAELLTLGATLRRLEVPDRDGKAANIVLGYRDLADYRAHPRFYGVVAGRYANRIGSARFTLDGTEYRLPANDGANTLHGGPSGFDREDWKVAARDAHSVTFALHSPHLDNGFPGNLDVRVRYAIEEGGLSVGFRATTDRATVANLTHHAYFNLAGEASGTTVLDHVLRIPAGQTTPTDAALIPTGELASVEGTPFDFRIPKPIGRDIAAADTQLAQGRGYDHNFVLVGAAGTIRRIATLFDPASGRVMDLQSTEPGVQFYTGNYLGGGTPGTGGSIYPARGGLCLEPQKFPDSPNKPAFPSARLDPGHEYRHDMAFRFRTAKDVAQAFG
ncbi:aldose epimerase family protein [Sphingomonas sp. LM7]|uniref:aldose epimerase family protein n=1 Tax=Sphingomonas sp. LM7 TaxID=1938607 RepID=UPI00155960A3|nr:aldose epimerase family protein [Sphingomonas sp. LM7]